MLGLAAHCFHGSVKTQLQRPLDGCLPISQIVIKDLNQSISLFLSRSLSFSRLLLERWDLEVVTISLRHIKISSWEMCLMSIY